VLNVSEGLAAICVLSSLLQVLGCLLIVGLITMWCIMLELKWVMEGQELRWGRGSGDGAAMAI
jgi:hypothetical protein